jgi:DNA polymerase III subunit chi
MTKACEVWFYHLERTPLEQALPGLLDKTLAKGWRALVRTAQRDRADQLDQMLWTYKDDSFLPHGLDGEPMSDRQPILITQGETNTNHAQALFLLDGAEPGALEGFERCIILFDGRDEGALRLARSRWKSLKDGGSPVSYWRENPERGWEKQA